MTTQNEARSQSLEDQKDTINAQIETARTMRELSTHDKDYQYWDAEIDRLICERENLPSAETLWREEHKCKKCNEGSFILGEIYFDIQEGYNICGIGNFVGHQTETCSCCGGDWRNCTNCANSDQQIAGDALGRKFIISGGEVLELGLSKPNKEIPF